MNTEPAVEVREVYRSFGRTVVLDGLTVAVPEGSVLGLLGVNGAGKSTLLRCLVGHDRPDRGRVTVLGQDPWCPSGTWYQDVAFASEDMAIPGWMSAHQAIRHCHRQYSRWDQALALDLLSRFDLPESRPFRSLSLGMQRRLLLLLRLCQHPRVLVLDEPANGLDAAARRQFLDLLVEFVCGPGRTVLFASHLLQDLERVVDHVAIIHQGRSLLQGELDDLKKRIRQVHLPATVSMDDLAGCGSVLGYRQGPHGVTALIRDLRAEAFASLVSRQGRQGHTDVHGLNLDDLFVALTRNDNQALAHAATTGADGRDSR